ncbi:unnamed protein product [Nippostrongylus brasiliensis]|uniref:P-type domain-containing protein n=1 Tax=Nippostrongylus brasiliensis TaxID=27835 RepID=A0A158QZG6_NIPBR|nr:unnamed protein product [Nippostrongylus brasiliensis]
MDCHPEAGASQDNCEARDCIWSPPPDQQVLQKATPWCYMKPGIGYISGPSTGSITYGPIADVNQKLVYFRVAIWFISTQVITLQKNSGPRNPWGDDIAQIHYKTQTFGKTANVKLFVGGRYEPPVDLPLNPSVQSGQTDNVFYFVVKRKSTGRRLFDTSIGGLIFSDKFLQLATYLPSDTMYGWGENGHQTIKHDFSNYTTWGMLARDEPPNYSFVDTKNLYVTTAPGPALIYRTIGGNLDLYFFPGPTPEEVVQQYLALIGTPLLPSYWSLGYQLSRYGYKDLADMVSIINRNIEAGIPLETNWSALGDFVKELHSKNMRNILIFDPAIEVDYDSFRRGMAAASYLKSGARFIEWERPDQDLYPMAKDTKIMLGVVWPDRHVAFPDFLDPTNVTTNWWIQEFVDFQKQVDKSIILFIERVDQLQSADRRRFAYRDSLLILIDTPWYYNSADHPNDAPLMCPTGTTDAEWDMPAYKTHAVYNFGQNLYGWSESRATRLAQHAATGKRGAVISRSTFPSSGRYAGHWLGDNSATWNDLRAATNEELCLRWQQMGAFHPFMRNHNTIGATPQDPARWPSVTKATIKANLFRYYYLPYLYSLHFAAAMNGGTVVRPVFFEFPTDVETQNLGHQFMWGSAVLIAPVVDQDDWYSLFDYNYGQWFAHGYQEFPAPWTSLIPVFVRVRNAAEGFLFWDDGETIVDSFTTYNYFQWSFRYQSDDEAAFLSINTIRNATLTVPTLDVIEIFNYHYNPDFTSFTLNGQKINVNVQTSYYNPFKKILYISTKNFLDLTVNGIRNLSWKHADVSEKRRIRNDLI